MGYPSGSGHILPYIAPLALIRIQYTPVFAQVGLAGGAGGHHANEFEGFNSLWKSGRKLNYTTRFQGKRFEDENT